MRYDKDSERTDTFNDPPEPGEEGYDPTTTPLQKGETVTIVNSFRSALNLPTREQYFWHNNVQKWRIKNNRGTWRVKPVPKRKMPESAEKG